jgi:uncharacterized protein
MVKKIIWFMLLFPCLLAQALDIPPAPTDRRWVQDYAEIFTASDERALLTKLRNYYDSTSNEFVVVTIPTLEDEDIFDYGIRLTDKWKIGQADKDNGLLILIAYENNDPNRRKVQIFVGDGLEGVITDLQAGKVYRGIMVPKLRQGRYAEAVDQAFDAFIAMSEGEFVYTGKKKKGIPLTAVIVIIIVIIILFSMIGGDNDGTTYRGRRSVHRPGGWWIGGGTNWNGGGSGWSGGGFSGGFGGGGFSGGGAGGSW